MIKTVIAGLLTASLVLGCGGGGDAATSTSSTSTSSSNTSSNGASSTGTSSGNTTGGSGTVTSIPTKAGDSYTYSRTDTSAASSTATTYFTTREYNAVNSDGSVSYTETYSSGFLASVTNISTTGAITSTGSVGSSTPTCTFTGVNAASVAPFAVGQSWDNNWTRTCGTTVVTGNNKGSIVGMESVTVPAGTFNAYKEVYTVTTQQTSPSNPTINITSYTCWRDAALRKRVKCEWNYATTAAGSSTQAAVSSSRYELNSYIASASSSSIPSASRFAGSWIGSFNGSDSGTCSNISISTSGSVSGTCVGNLSGTFSVSGTVNSQGVASFSSGTTSNGAVFTGQFPSTVAANGSWSGGPSTGGNWSISHK
ncbi:hypothetical protein [Herbaspirillum sp. ST 5-3]|uniref:hypothetical protein n=1 Tax=Oxalobacteraceae TaxID=75682 RepID=UPI0010A520E8|nr:hypothetical protein [Herbaspirillum sp. ST 5-3]